ncbi:Tubulin-specific chaperone E-like [Oopsacas minuta]|uniref:Tubulin-specific chaperone E n=1 Tax=Oopsacas minuta TaxID=111878 RepID=A0AAV7KAS8_9METZ|nr:Tubulin-specific chaperone E-like [Oopsacas minuta]
MSSISILSELDIGRRCCCGEDYGVIRFIGDVEDSKGTWVGIEWDKVERGKHNGSLKGKQYFICKKEENCASFLRPKKLSLGMSLPEALLHRYTNVDPEGYMEESERLIVGNKGGAVKVELVGMDSVFEERSKLCELKIVSLINMKISNAGSPGELAQLAPNIATLELVGNKMLPDWKTISLIAQQLNSLTSLDLSDTNLELPEDPLVLTPRLSQLTELYLCSTGISWDRVCEVSHMVPFLSKLHLCFNNISIITTQLKCFTSLELLNLEENDLCDWEHIFSLKTYPNLSTLILNNNQLPDIPYHLVTGHESIQFSSLSSLSLRDNMIGSWYTVDFINSYFKLKELRIKNNPVLSNVSSQQARQFVIARIATLTILNNSPVPLAERIDAERYYLSAFSRQWVESCDESGCVPASHPFRREHPRYLLLVNEIGAPADAKADVLKANRFYDVTISAPNYPNLNTLKKKLPHTLTIQKLKGVLHRLYKIDPADQMLSYVREEFNCPEIEMDDTLRPLSYYGMQSGYIILVRSK